MDETRLYLNADPRPDDCNKQLFNGPKTKVTMQSGRVVKLGRCNLRKGHRCPCGRVESQT